MKRMLAARRGLSRWGLVFIAGLLSFALVLTDFSGSRAATPNCSKSELNLTAANVGTSTAETGKDAYVIRSGGYCYVIIKKVGTGYTWTPPSGVTAVRALVVAGGGGGGGSLYAGGGHHSGGGGGAGGFFLGNISVSTSAIPITVGGGGVGLSSFPAKGGDSVFGSTTMKGGGYGAWVGTSPTYNAGADGGSGGGGGAQVTAYAPGSALNSAYGFGGGAARLHTTTYEWQAGGGGGGAGAAGATVSQSATQYPSGGAGGVGKVADLIPTSIASAISVGEVSGSSVYFAGGGGGGRRYSASNALPGAGGLGGGSAGVAGTATPASATANTGGGGGASSYLGGDGGSGVVILRYESPYLEVTTSSDLGAVAGQAFLTQPSIQIKNFDNTNAAVQNIRVDVAIDGGAVLQGTSYADTNSSGEATFSNLGIQTGTLGATYTLTFSATGYFSTTKTVVLRKYPDRIDVVTTASDANGAWSNGTWLTTTNGVSNLNATALGTAINDQVVSLRTPGSFYMGPAVTATTSGKGIKIAAGDYIGFGALLTLNNGPVTLLANADGSNGANGGNIFIDGSGSGISSGGGSIILAGGSYTDTSGYAVGYNTATGSTPKFNSNRNIDNAGIYIAGSVNSGGGSITMNARVGTGAADSAGFYMATNGTISAGGGSIVIKGEISSDLTDISVSHRAVRITNGTISTTGAGSISITATTTVSATTSQDAALFENASISSVNGNISIISNNHVGASTGLYFATANSSVTATGTGGITMTANSSTNGDYFTKLTTLSAGGAISITTAKPITIPNAWSTSGPLTLESTAGSVTVNASQTVTGSGNRLLLKATDAVIFGPSITIQTNGGDIVAWSDSNSTAGGYIKVDATVTMRSNGGKIWLAGGADDGGTAAGITSAKGAWSTLALNDQLPDGYAQGNATQLDGVFLSTDHLLYSAGGDIFIAGMNTASADHYGSTIKTYYGTIDSGTGRIAMWGKAAATAYYTFGLNLHYYSNSSIPQVITSANKTAQAITIYGDSGPSTHSGSDGVWSPWYSAWLSTTTGHQGLRVLATGLADASNPGGTINITGIGSNVNGGGGGDGVHLDFVDLLAKAGAINVTGYESDGVGDYSSRSIFLGGNGNDWASNQSQNLVRFGAWTDYSTATGGNLYTNQAGIQTNFATSAADINLLGDKMGFIESDIASAGQGYKFTTSGDIAIQPVSASFAVNQDTTHWHFGRVSIGGTPSSFTLGKDGNRANVNWYYPVSASGPIKIYAENLHVYDAGADLTTTMDAASSGANNPGILLKSAEKLYLTNDVHLTTSGADITLWSDFDNNGVGSIQLEGNNKLKSSGGKITLAGGLDDGATNNTEITGRSTSDGYPDNYAGGLSGWYWDSGIRLDPGYVFASGGGDIFIAGRSAAVAASENYGILAYGGLIYSETGKIAMYGKIAAANTNWHRGIVFSWGNAPTSIVSDSPASDAIKIYGDASSSIGGESTAAFGIETWDGRTTIAATATGGGVEIIGKNGSGTHNNGAGQFSAPVELNYVNIWAKSGPISITGTSTSNTNEGVFIGGRGTGQSNTMGYSASAASTGYSELASVSVTASTSPISIVGTGSRVYVDAVAKTSFSNKNADGFLLKSSGHVELTSSSSVTTGGSRATFWSRSASTENTAAQSGEGAIYLGDGVSISTNGGAITLAGSSSETDSLPTGHAYTNTASTDAISLGISGGAAAAVSLNSGDGDVRIYGQTGASARMAFASKNSASSITSGSGRQDLDFIGGNNSDNVFEAWGSIAFTSSASANPVTPAIKVSIRQANSSNPDTPIQQQGTFAHTFASTGGGDIYFSVSTAHTSAYAVDRFRDFYFLASSGKISVDLGSNGVDLAYATATDKVIFGADGTRVTSSSASVEITSGKFVDNANNGSVVVKTSGVAYVQPKATSFLVDQTFDGTWAFSGNSTGTVGGITFGKSGNASGITLSSANTATGDINVFAAASTINSNQTTTGSGNINITSSAAVTGAGNLNAGGNIVISGTSFAGTGSTTSGGAAGTSITATAGNIALTNSNSVSGSDARFVAKASANVSTSSASPIRTNSGKIVLWSDSDNSGGGTITVVGALCTAPSSVITCSSTTGTGGDDVIIGGSTASATDETLPGGYATGTAVTTKFTSTGVQLGTLGAANNSGPKIYTYGGNVEIAGQTASGAVSEYTYGVNLMVATEIHTSLGKISILGKNNANASSTGARLGVELNGWGSTGSLKLVSTNTDEDSIVIKALSTNASDTVGFNATNIGSEITSSGGVKIQSNHIASDSKIKWAVAKTIVLEPVDTSFSAALDFDSDYTFTSNPGGLRLGKQGNATGVTTSTAVNAIGSIEIYASTATINSNLTTGTSSTALIKADTIAINTSNSITSTSGVVTFAPATSTREIDLGSETVGKLSLTSAELNRITAGTIRIGEISGTNTGAITVSADIAPSGTTNLAIRTGGNISGSGIITETNLGLDAGGTINLTGMNLIGGNLAITAGGASAGSGVGFSSGSATYTAGTVDSIIGVFGVPAAFSMSQVPYSTPTDAFMAVKFDPPPTITFEDNYGYVIQAANTLGDTQTVTASMASGSGTLAGTTTVTSIDGVATFDNLNISSSTGNHTITFTSGSLTATTGTYNVLAGEPASLVVSMLQTTISAGKTFNAGTIPTVTLKDVGGNTIASGTHATATVTATLIGTGGSIIAGQTKSAEFGVATFDTLALAGTVGQDYSLQFTVEFIDTAGQAVSVDSTETSITFTPGDATTLNLITTAQGFANRSQFTTQPIIEVLDEYSNRVNDYVGDVEVQINSGTLTGQTSVAVSEGIATFADLGKHDIIGEDANRTLTFSAGDLVSDSQTFVLTFGAAYQLELTRPAAGFVNNEMFEVQPQITVQDQDGNLVEDFTGEVIVTQSSGTLAGEITVNAQAGIATFSGLVLTGSTATSYSLTFETYEPYLQVVQNEISLVAGAPHHLSIIQSPSSAFNRMVFATQPIIEIQDISNNPVPNSGLTVAVSSNAMTLMGTLDVLAESGQAVFSELYFQDLITISAETLTFTATGLEPVATNVTVTHGAASKLTVRPAEVSAISGEIFTSAPEVTIEDADGNTVTDSTLVVSVSVLPSAGGALPAGTSATGFDDQIFGPSGVLSFNQAIISGVAQEYTVTYSATGIQSTSQTVHLTHSAAAKLVKIAMPTGARAGIQFGTNPTFEIRDAYDNIVDTGEFATSVVTATVAHNEGNRENTNLGSVASINEPVTAIAVEGVVEFTDIYLTGDAGDTYEITFSVSTPSNDISANTQNLTLSAGNPYKLSVITQPENLVAGENFIPAPQVQIVDEWNNPVEGVSESFAIQANLVNLDGVLLDNSQPAVTVSGANDTATFDDISFSQMGSHKLAFSSQPQLISVTSQQFEIQSAAADHLAFVTEGSKTVRNGHILSDAPVLQILDAFDNPVSAGPATTVVVSVVGENRADVAGIEGSQISTVSGSNELSFDDLAIHAKSGSYTLRFTALNEGLPIDGAILDFTETIEVTFGDAAGLVISQPANGARAGLEFDQQPRVQVVDANENLVADSDLQIEAGLTDANYELIGSGPASALMGEAQFNDLAIAGEAATNITLVYSAILSNGTAVQVSQSIDLEAGDVSNLVTEVGASTVQTGSVMDPAPSVTLRDTWGNTVLSDSSTRLQLQLYDASDNPVLGQTATASADQGTVTFTDLIVSAPAADGYYFVYTVLDNSNLPLDIQTSTNTFEITPGAPTEIEIVTAPHTWNGTSRTKSGDELKIQPLVQILDADGNLATQVDGQIATISVIGDGGIIRGNTTAVISGGQAQFAGVKLSGKSARAANDAVPAQSAVHYTFTFKFEHQGTVISTSTTDNPDNPVIVDHNKAHHLAIVRDAGVAKAGKILVGSAAPIVEIRDADDNLVNTSGTGSEEGLSISATVKKSGTSSTLQVFNNGISANQGVAVMNVGFGGLATDSYIYTFSVQSRANSSLANYIRPVSQSDVQITYGNASKIVQRTAVDSSFESGLTMTGEALAVQPVFELQDDYGNIDLDAGAENQVQASLVGGSNANEYLENTEAFANAGLVTFSDLTLVGIPNQPYLLAFSWMNVEDQVITTPENAPITVTHNFAAQLRIATQPATGSINDRTKTGDRLATQPVVEVLDRYGNLVSNDDAYSSVRMIANLDNPEISDPPSRLIDLNDADATEISAAISGGMATFTSLGLVALPEELQYLRFSATGLTGTTETLITEQSQPFTVTYAKAAKLAMVTQPCTGMLSILTEAFCISGASGEILGVQPAVEVLDRFNNRVLNYSGEVTVSLLKDEADQASLSVAEGESLTVSFENGIATFSGISLTGTPRTNYRLNFTSSDPENSDAVLTSATSAPIEVLHAAPSQIVIVTQPVGAKTGDLLAVQPRIEIRDEFGNLADTDSTTEIRVVASGGNLEGTTTIQVDEGIAQFSDLTFIGSPLSTYTLTFTSEQIAGAFAESEDFHVTHGDVVSIEWVIEPSAGKTGDRISAELVMLDFDGNVATTVTADEISADVFSGGGQLENATGSVTEGFIAFDNLILIASPGVPQQISVAATISGIETRSPPSTAVSLTHADPAYISIDTNICAGDITSDGCQLGESRTLMGSQPVLNVFDRFGNPTDTDNSTQVTVSINAENSGDANGALDGNTTITVANGVAEFTNLTFAGSPGVEYTFSFAASFAGQSISGVNDETVSRVSVQTEFDVFEYESVAYSDGGTADPIITTNVTEGTNIEFSYTTDSPESICVVDSTTGRVSIHGAGICVVNVVASAVPYFRPSSEISAEFVISKAVQAPLSVVTSADEVDYKQITLLTPTYEGGSGTGAVELYTLGECRLIDGKLFTYNAGSCTIRAIKAEDANYLERVSPAKVITINKVPQEDLYIGNTNTTSVGDLTLFVTGGSGNGAVTYSVHPLDAANCSIVANVKLHRSTSGTCRVKADKAGSTNFTVASSPFKTITFAKKAQTVSFGGVVPAYPAIGTSYVPLATASSGNAVTFSLSGYTDANNPQGTTAETCIFDPLDATKVKFTAAGFCEITATQSGTDEFEQASTKRIIAINLLNQSIDFASIPDTKYGSPAFVVKASSSSGLVVNLAIGSATTSDSCGISGITSAKNSSGAVITSALVKVNYSGICEIVATQPGNGTYAKASPVSRVFQIAPDQAGPPKISSISISNQAFTATFTPPSYLGGSALNGDTPFFLEITRTDTGDVYGGSNCALNNGTYTCVVPGLPNEKQYTATVSAITAAGAGLPSAVAGPITATKNPMGVTNLTLEQPSETSLQVNWEDPSVLDGALQNYAVYVAPLGSTDYQFISTTTSTNYDVTLATSPLAAVRSGLSGGGGVRYASAAAFLPVRNSLPTYSANGYQVKVITVTSTFDALSEEDKNAFEAEYSSVGKQIIDGIPSEPRSLSATRESGKIYVSWAAPLYDGGAAISQYALTVTGPTGTLCTQDGALETSCTISTADPYSNYSFAVVAVNANQKSSAASTFALTDAIAKPTPKPEPKPTAEPTSEPTPAPTKEPTPEPTTQPTPQPTAAPTSEPTAAPTPEPSEAPSPEPTFEAPVDVPPPIEPAPGVSVAPQPTEVTNPIEALSPTIELPTINPGEPVANPAIGATGDDSAPPQEFSPLSSPEGVAAATETATKAVTMVSAVAAAAAAAAAGAAAAAAAGASAAAGAAAGAASSASAAGSAGGAASGGGSTGGGNSGGSSSSSSSEAGRRPDDFAAGEEGQDSEGGDDPESIDVTQDNITIDRESWGDKLAMFTLPFITFLDRRSHNAAERIAKISPFAAKLINDGAYLRAMLGTLSTALPIAAAVIALAAVADNAAEIAAGDYSKIITPAWFFLLAIAVLGAFDAAAGFTGAMVFIIGSVITVGHIPDSGEIRTMMGIMLVSVAPALLTTGFRTIRKHAALNFNAWWERIADFVIAPFMAGWSVSAMVSGLPALAGLTLDVANHVNDFVFFIAIAIFIRVALEELAAAGFPARLNRINPDEIPDPSILQRSIVLVIKYGVWVFIGGALIGPSWQVWVGSALFVFPTVIGWFTDKFPNSPSIWRLLPTGIPGLAFTLFVASATSATVGAILGTTPDLGKWSFLILPIPMLAITVLGWFGRHGAIDAEGNEEERPGKRNKWIYRIGGVVVMVLTLKLAGVI